MNVIPLGIILVPHSTVWYGMVLCWLLPLPHLGGDTHLAGECMATPWWQNAYRDKYCPYIPHILQIRTCYLSFQVQTESVIRFQTRKSSRNSTNAVLKWISSCACQFYCRMLNEALSRSLRRTRLQFHKNLTQWSVADEHRKRTALWNSATDMNL